MQIYHLFALVLISQQYALIYSRNPNALFPHTQFNLKKFRIQNVNDSKISDFFADEEVDTHWYSPYTTKVRIGNQELDLSIQLHSNRSIIFQNQQTVRNQHEEINCFSNGNCLKQKQQNDNISSLGYPLASIQNLSLQGVDLTIFNQKIQVQSLISVNNSYHNRTQYLRFVSGILGIGQGSQLFQTLAHDFGFSVYLSNKHKEGKFIIGEDDDKKHNKEKKLVLKGKDVLNNWVIKLSHAPIQSSKSIKFNAESQIKNRYAVFDMQIDALAIPQADYDMFIEELFQHEIVCFPQLNSPYQECILLDEGANSDDDEDGYNPLVDLPVFSFFTESMKEIKIPPSLYFQPIDKQRSIYQLIIAPTITFEERTLQSRLISYEIDDKEQKAKDKIPVENGFENHFILGSYFMSYYYVVFKSSRQSGENSISIYKAVQHDRDQEIELEITHIYLGVALASVLIIIGIQLLVLKERKKSSSGVNRIKAAKYNSLRKQSSDPGSSRCQLSKKSRVIQSELYSCNFPQSHGVSSDELVLRSMQSKDNNEL